MKLERRSKIIELIGKYQIETQEKFQFQSGIKNGLSKMQILTAWNRRLF